MENIEEYIVSMAQKAHEASLVLATSDASLRNQCLRDMAQALREQRGEILKANDLDCQRAQKESLSDAMIDRLRLDEDRIEKMAISVEQIAAQPEVVGRIEDKHTRPNGLEVARMRIPLGVIAIIYEARPNVTSDAAALCLKSANAVILKGGKEAFQSNLTIAHILQNCLEKNNLPRACVSFVESIDRSAVSALIVQNQTIDLLIPRGGEGLIRFVTAHATIPTIQHFKGVCHIFVEKSADIDKAIAIVCNAKCQRPGVCNAMETLLLDASLAIESQRCILNALAQKGVLLHADDSLMNDFSSTLPSMVAATTEDWPKEYLSLDLAVRRVGGLDEAIDHIHRYSSLHTEAILTQDKEAADIFVKAINSSTVLVNASTRFADGGELGLGAEIGISTTKLHAFGPMGCADLTTRKFVVLGAGQVRQ